MVYNVTALINFYFKINNVNFKKIVIDIIRFYIHINVLTAKDLAPGK